MKEKTNKVFCVDVKRYTFSINVLKIAFLKKNKFKQNLFLM